MNIYYYGRLDETPLKKDFSDYALLQSENYLKEKELREKANEDERLRKAYKQQQYKKG